LQSPLHLILRRASEPTGGTLANVLSWTAPATGDAPSKYKIYAIHAATGAFGASSLIGTVDAPLTTFTHVALSTSDTWRYFVVASNSGGDSAATAAANATTSATGGGSSTLDGLTDVDTSTTPPTNGQALVYDTGTSLWKPGSVASGGAGNGASGYRGCLVYNNGTQSIPNATSTALTWDTEQWDEPGIHSTGSNPSRFTCPQGLAGKWRFTWSVQFSSGATNARVSFLRKNGGTDANNVIGSASKETPASAFGIHAHGSCVVELAEGDYIEVFVYQDSGGAMNVGSAVSGPADCNFLHAELMNGGGGAVSGGLVKLDQYIVTGSPAASITFTGFSQAYEDLVVAGQGQLTGNADFVWGSLNGDTTTNYYWGRGYDQITGNGYSTGTSTGLDVGLMDGAATVAGTYGGIFECVIYSYARTNWRKRSLAKSSLRTTSTTGISHEGQVSEWSNTAAVNSITLTPNSGSFAVGTVITLYGRGGSPATTNTSPPTGLATWVNQGTTVKTVDKNGSIKLVAPMDVADNNRGVFMALPSTPWRYRIGFNATLLGVNYQHAGIALRESSSGKMVIFGAYRETAGLHLWLIANYNSPTSKNANVVATAPPVDFFRPLYINIADDGVNRTASFGYDLYDQIFAPYSVAHNSFLVADQIGIYVNNFNASNPLAMSAFYWEAL
jgi:hypothetical protein